ncbi:MAG: YebC/PmpR family DNA-binding transcriptional regulator [Caldiserica bacterium]|nr:MAG: YebC/PmpR family DNA-binding transcriptional regulator [Caldisericota bacterium]RLD15779.1 MAG: YebC/PmpR family DNA-binding transcriptional regulator [Caldisericota bacterium]
MSGHSKWHNIQARKSAVDKKKGKLFSKLIREITIAAREGGGDPETNPRLRTAIEKAKEANMPSENIKKAILRGTGQLEGQKYEEIVYEGYGPGGVAVYVEAVTDNKNRTTAEIRRIFSKHGGSLGENGCVSWMFERKGQLKIDPQGMSDDDILLISADAGAEDLKREDGEVYVYTSPSDLYKVKQSLEESGIKVVSADFVMIPKNGVKVEGDKAEQTLKLISELEDHDDIQKVFSNFEISDEEMERIALSMK